MKKTYLMTAIALVILSDQITAAYNYAEALQKSIYFYMQQRTGDLPDDNPVIWRADSCLKDGADAGVDLAGGYYDAGDHVKFGLPLASTITTLCWGVYEYRDAYAGVGQLDEVLDAIRWGTDYLIKCHTGPNEFYYQVGDGKADHAWWGPIEVIEEVMSRPSYKVTTDSPGSCVVGAAAAALASASVIFKQEDPNYASTCLAHGRELFDFAYTTQSDAGYTASTGFYNTYGFWDELSAAAIWLYIATGDETYRDKAEYTAGNWPRQKDTPYLSFKGTHSWNHMNFMAQILLARATGKQVYLNSIERNLDWWLPGGGITYTPGGLAWRSKWGSLRSAANAAFLAFVWSDDSLGILANKPEYRRFAERQINYILGDNPRNSSYLIGFGVNSPQNPHHRTAHGSWYNDINDPPVSVHTLIGALVGGPDSGDSYNDDRTDYISNEVACDYNACLVGALAKMVALHGGKPLADFPKNYFKPADQRRDEYFVRAAILSETPTSIEIVTQLTNRSAWPPTIKENLSFRYFFDLTETYTAGLTVNDITFTLAAHEGATLTGPFPWNDKVYYIVLDFTGAKIYPGGRDQCEKMANFILKAPTPAAWDTSNDWSRQGLTEFPFTYEPIDLTGKTNYICVYDKDTLIWGQEPPRK
ncbi:MAG: glycoside hydrolase family 9 protein [Sedimentisphaerales bacterium]|nr:glycoside hydrolase family 9 protein [Sedimentisphaerales bacterium]